MERELSVGAAEFARLCRELSERRLPFCFRARGVSMSPAIRSGDAVLVRPAEAAEISVGDVILLSTAHGMRAHRVTESNPETQTLTTRGDSCDRHDVSASWSEVIGRIVPGSHTFSVIHGTLAPFYRVLRKLRDLLFCRAAIAMAFVVLLLMLLFVLPASAATSVVVDSTTSLGHEIRNGVDVDSTTTSAQQVSTGNANTTFSFTHTTAGANRLLLVGVSINLTNNTGLTVSGITYGGTALTLVGTSINANSRRVEVWRLLNPALGTNTIQVTMAGVTATAAGVVVGATTFVGVNQTTPLGTFVSNTGNNNTTPTVTVASAVGELVFGTMAAGGNRTVTVNAAEAGQWNITSGGANANTDVRALGVTAPGAASVTLSETLSGNSNWSYGGIDVKPASPNTATLTFAHTTAGANTLLVVGVSFNLTNNAAATVSSITYNGVALTLIGTQNDASNTRRIEMWQLISPTAGANNVVVTISGLTATGTSFGVVAGATTFDNVDQNAPLGTFASASDNTGTSTNPNVTVASNQGAMIIDTMAAGGNVTVSSFTGNQTQQWNLTSIGTAAAVDVLGFGSTAPAAPNVTMSEVLSAGSNWAIGAVPVNPVTADVAIAKSINPSPPTSGSNATYTLTVTNAGPSSATGVVVTDPLPPTATLVGGSVTTTQGSCSGTTTITCNLGTVAKNATVTITFTVTVGSLGGLNNTATVTLNEFDPNTGNNTASNLTFAQTASCSSTTAPPAGGTLTGIINTYFPGTASAAAGAKSITVGASSGSATGIAIGDMLLVIQMQDAAIDSSNTNTYGSGVAGPPSSGSTNLNNAGVYEYVQATSALTTAGGTVNISGSGLGGGLLYAYTLAAASATQGQRTFQVVRVPQYSTATLSSTLSATPWTCALGTTNCVGGILAFDVASVLTLGGTVDLSGFGFRGGGGRILGGGAGAATDYRTLASNNANASKGEGIAGTPRFVYNQQAGTLVDNGAANEGYPNGSYARGAPGTAGGGGTDGDPPANDDNSGGGGGANGGTGGLGGDGWHATTPSGGYGGTAFPATATRITMGGGGGSGTTNNGTSDPNTNTTGINSSGAAGGGIIIIRAGSAAGAGTLQANGATALNVMNDGGGGGGAGGTIVVLAASGVLTGLTANVAGGAGGNTWLTQAVGTPYPGNRHGPGGGGGGGVVIVTSTPLAATNLSGGAGGVTTTGHLQYGNSGGTGLASVISVAASQQPGVQSQSACTDLSITKSSAPSPVKTGNTLTYTLTVTNNGFSVATNATVSDTLPAQVTFVSATPSQGSCAQAAGTVTCNLGNLAVGASATISIATTAGAPNNVSNTATVSNNQTDTNTANNSATNNNTIVFPTSVGLQAFTASRLGGRVLLRWSTTNEARNLGFNVYREENGQRVRVNPSLIAGTALQMRNVLPQHSSRSYAWLDAAPSVAGAYWIEDVEINGDRTWHGPVSAASVTAASGSADLSLTSSLSAEPTLSSSPLLSQLSPMTVVGRTSLRPVPAPQLTTPGAQQRAVQFWLASQSALKISVDHEGWYSIPQSQLAAAGFRAPLASLHLYAEGVEQPLKITNTHGAAAIEFYGTGIDTDYSDTRVYWLVSASGSGISVPRIVAMRPLQAPQSFPYTVERKDRTTYFAALLNGDADNFFGAIVASQPVDQPLTLAHLDPAAGGFLRVNVVMQGVTKDQPHLVAVSFNGSEIGQISFSDQAQGSAVFSVPVNLAQEGANNVTLQSLNGDNDLSLVDHIDITYPHTFVADSDWLRFSAPAGSHIVAQGFTSTQVHAFDITTPARVYEIPVGTGSGTGGAYTATLNLPGNSSMRTVLLLAEDAFESPLVAALNQPSDLHSAQAGSQMVIITHPQFALQIAPLRDLHQQQGLSTRLVSVEDVYDEFNFGERSPQALRDFMRATQSMWQTRPRFLLLAGRASVDPRNYLGFGDLDFVPTRMVDTAELETSSDDWFTDFSGVGVPTVATGRLPVSTPAEAALLVGKIVQYESSAASQSWARQAMMVADRNDGFDFAAASQKAQSQIPSTIAVSSVLADDLDDATARQQILEGFNQGQLLINYTGHGSTEVWSGDDLFASSDAAALSNGSRLPVVVTMDCLNGYFQDVYTHSLAVALLLAPNGGAVAAWSSSGLTQPDPQAQMDFAFISLVFSQAGPTLGEAAQAAKFAAPDMDVRRTWILFGDPAMKLPINTAPAQTRFGR